MSTRSLSAKQQAQVNNRDDNGKWKQKSHSDVEDTSTVLGVDDAGDAATVSTMSSTGLRRGPEATELEHSLGRWLKPEDADATVVTERSDGSVTYDIAGAGKTFVDVHPGQRMELPSGGVHEISDRAVISYIGAEDEQKDARSTILDGRAVFTDSVGSGAAEIHHKVAAEGRDPVAEAQAKNHYANESLPDSHGFNLAECSPEVREAASELNDQARDKGWYIEGAHLGGGFEGIQVIDESSNAQVLVTCRDGGELDQDGWGVAAMYTDADGDLVNDDEDLMFDPIEFDDKTDTQALRQAVAQKMSQAAEKAKAAR